jgi:hypothetical protein
MLDWLPELLEGLFDMLADVNRDIRQQAYAALSEFLDQMQAWQGEGRRAGYQAVRSASHKHA